MFINVQVGLKCPESFDSHRLEDVSQPIIRIYNNTLHSTSSFGVGRIHCEYIQFYPVWNTG